MDMTAGSMAEQSSDGSDDLKPLSREERRRLAWSLDSELEDMAELDDDPDTAGSMWEKDPTDAIDFYGKRGRRLLQTGDPLSLGAQVGVEKEIRIALADNLGNPQKADDSRLLDQLDASLGEVTCVDNNLGVPVCGRGFGVPCRWIEQPRGLPVLDYRPGCTPVFIGFGLNNSTAFGPYDPRTNSIRPDYGFPASVTGQGLSLSLYNDFSGGAFVIKFKIDGQLPALTLGPEVSYMLDLTLNGAPLGGGPFRLVVVPGTIYHTPPADIFMLTARVLLLTRVLSLTRALSLTRVLLLTRVGLLTRVSLLTGGTRSHLWSGVRAKGRRV
jgi:hypothetical protein